MRQYSTIACLPADKHHFHVLKHTRAIELGDLGTAIEDIQWWLGHQSINNTLIYAQFTTTKQQVLYNFLEEVRYHYVTEQKQNEKNICLF